LGFGFDPVVVLVIGDELGFTIGVEFGFGVGVATEPFADVFVVAFGFTIGLDVGFGLGFELGFGAGVVVTGVPVVAAALAELDVVVAAAGFVPAVPEPDAELFELALLELLAGAPLAPAEPALPPFDCAKETAATEPISNAAMDLERVFISPPCLSR
jgi:hypothetical protein